MTFVPVTVRERRCLRLVLCSGKVHGLFVIAWASSRISGCFSSAVSNMEVIVPRILVTGVHDVDVLGFRRDLCFLVILLPVTGVCCMLSLWVWWIKHYYHELHGIWVRNTHAVAVGDNTPVSILNCVVNAKCRWCNGHRCNAVKRV